MEKGNKALSRRDFMNLAVAGAVSLAFRGIYKSAPGFEPLSGKDDVLDSQTQAALAEKAQSLIRPKPQEAIALSDTLRNSSESSAGNICGPLALAQLRGNVNYGVRPQDFWLAAPNDNPSTDENLFEEAFPPSKFDNFSVHESVETFDFDSINLQPGDFLFLYGGSWHMMTISRRGPDGILYGITNYPGPDKNYIIEEVPFWNPADPAKSWIKELGRGENSTGFRSGTSGFNLWRLARFQESAFDQFEQTSKADILQKKIIKLADSAVGDWKIFIQNMATGKILAENAARIEHHAASIFKVPLSMVFMKYLETVTKNEADYKNVLLNEGLEGRTFDQLLTAMLVHSEEKATYILTEFLISKNCNRDQLASSFGSEETSIENRYSTADDMSKFFGHIFDLRTFKYQFTHSYLLKLLSTYTPEDNTRLGKLRNDNIGVTQIADKRGSIALNGLVVVADAGIVFVKNSAGEVTPYFVYLNGASRKDKTADYDYLDKTELTGFVEAFADYFRVSVKGVPGAF